MVKVTLTKTITDKLQEGATIKVAPMLGAKLVKFGSAVYADEAEDKEPVKRGRKPKEE